MLILCDLDGTVIWGYMDNPDKAYHTWHVLPGRVQRLAELREAGHLVGLVTNQGAVAFGLVLEQEAVEKIASALAQLGLPADTPVAVCYSDMRGRPPYNKPEDAARRKPSGAMIRELMAAHPEAAADGVLFVGDRPEDEAAAQDAGVRFAWAEQFFGAGGGI